MKHLSYTYFVENYLPTLRAYPDFVQHIKILYHLMLRYKKKLLLSSFQKSIYEQHPSLYTLLAFFATYNFLDKQHLGKLYHDILASERNFTYSYPKDTTLGSKIEHILTTQFDTTIITSTHSSDIGVEIKGQGYHYKRHINDDISKLLQ